MKLLVLITCMVGSSSAQIHPSFVAPADLPGRPRILVLGDSISMGYTIPLRERVGQLANVLRAPENCRSSRQLRARLEHYLETKAWNVILFNCGLHDVVSIGPDGKGLLPSVGGTVQVSREEYRRHLEAIVARLKQTGALLLWVSTTPVGENQYRRKQDVEQYNADAAGVMRRHGIRVVDLHGFVSGGIRLGEIDWSDGVHFTEASYAVIAAHLAEQLNPALVAR